MRTHVDRGGLGAPIRSAPSGHTCPATSEAPPPLLNAQPCMGLGPGQRPELPRSLRQSWRRIEGVLTIRRVPDHPHPRADRHVHERGLLAKPHHHGLRRRSGRPGSGQGRVRPAPPGQSCRAAVTGRPVRPRPARTRSTAGRCRLLPAPELDRVDRRPLCGDPYRGDQQPLILIYRERKLGFMLGLARSTGLVVPSEFRVSITPE